jgi:TIR domain
VEHGRKYAHCKVPYIQSRNLRHAKMAQRHNLGIRLMKAYNIFISYPRVSKGITTWVSAFRQDLEDKLKEKLSDREAKVFLDTRDIGIGPLDTLLKDALRETDIFLIVLSHRWFDSVWCQLELAAFVDAVGGKEKARARIVLVRLDDVKKHRNDLNLGNVNWGDLLGGLHEYDFFTIDPTHKVTLILGVPDFPQLRRDYLLTMLELVGDENRPGLAFNVTNRPDNRPRIFLADVTPDMSKDRRMLKDYLDAEGFCVVPTRSFYHAPPNYEREVLELLNTAQMFIQLLGAFRFETTNNFPDGYEEWQLRLARQSKARGILRWRRPDVVAAAVEDAEHRRSVFADDVIACDLQDFKVTFKSKLSEINNKINRDDGEDINPDEKRILVNVTNADSEFGRILGTKVEALALQNNLRRVSAELVSDYSSLFEIARSNVWHGLVIVYGEGQQEWALKQMHQARRAVLDKKGAPCRVYLRPKEKHPPEPLPVIFRLIRDGAEAEIEQFLKEVALV